MMCLVEKWHCQYHFRFGQCVRYLVISSSFTHICDKYCKFALDTSLHTAENEVSGAIMELLLLFLWETRCKFNDVIALINSKVSTKGTRTYINRQRLDLLCITIGGCVCVCVCASFLWWKVLFYDKDYHKPNRLPVVVCHEHFYLYLSLPRSNLLVSSNFLFRLSLDRKCHSERMATRIWRVCPDRIPIGELDICIQFYLFMGV